LDRRIRGLILKCLLAELTLKFSSEVSRCNVIALGDLRKAFAILKLVAYELRRERRRPTSTTTLNDKFYSDMSRAHGYL
jgi:hypothetical protein